MTRKLTILIAPIDNYGTVNPAIGIGQRLKNRGHQVVFAVDQNWRGQLTKYGFDEEVYWIRNSPSHSKNYSKMVDFALIEHEEPIERAKKAVFIFTRSQIERDKEAEPRFKVIIEKVQPDVIIIDNFFVVPSVYASGIPWVQLISCNPLSNIEIEFDGVPPKTSGLPSTDRSQWEAFRTIYNKFYDYVWSCFNLWAKSKGVLLKPYQFITNSPHLNIYQFPRELDYTDLWQPPSHFQQIDTFIRTEDSSTKFRIPLELLGQKGKLIYFSLGPIGAAHHKLMARLMSLLEDIPHKFVVCTGNYARALNQQHAIDLSTPTDDDVPNDVAPGEHADKYSLPVNCWGQPMLPQTRVIPMVDLVITHGGNNTLCETFYFGKPMIVMPIFGDQFDNAQRLDEKGLAVRLDPYTCTRQQLSEAIDGVLGNKKLVEEMKRIGERIQQEDKKGRLEGLIEGLVSNSL